MRPDFFGLSKIFWREFTSEFETFVVFVVHWFDFKNDASTVSWCLWPPVKFARAKIKLIMNQCRLSNSNHQKAQRFFLQLHIWEISIHIYQNLPPALHQQKLKDAKKKSKDAIQNCVESFKKRRKSMSFFQEDLWVTSLMNYLYSLFPLTLLKSQCESRLKTSDGSLNPKTRNSGE